VNGGVGAIERSRRLGRDIKAASGIANRTATKAIAAWRGQRCAIGNALLGLRSCTICRIKAVGTNGARGAVRRAENAAYMNRATVIASAAVAIKEAILIDSIDTVAWNAGAKTVFPVV
jgi:hypothetical protein